MELAILDSTNGVERGTEREKCLLHKLDLLLGEREAEDERRVVPLILSLNERLKNDDRLLVAVRGASLAETAIDVLAADQREEVSHIPAHLLRVENDEPLLEVGNRAAIDHHLQDLAARLDAALDLCGKLARVHKLCSKHDGVRVIVIVDVVSLLVVGKIVVANGRGGLQAELLHLRGNGVSDLLRVTLLVEPGVPVVDSRVRVTRHTNERRNRVHRRLQLEKSLANQLNLLVRDGKIDDVRGALPLDLVLNEGLENDDCLLVTVRGARLDVGYLRLAVSVAGRRLGAADQGTEM